MDIAFSEGDRERERERAEREGRREMGIYSVTFTLITGVNVLLAVGHVVYMQKICIQNLVMRFKC